LAVAISTQKRRGQKPKIQKNKIFYRLFSPAVIRFIPARHFANSTKKRRSACNTEGQLFPSTSLGQNRHKSAAAQAARWRLMKISAL